MVILNRLSLTFFYFLFVSLTSLSVSSLTDEVFLDCGSSQTTNSRGRSWTGDIRSEFISIEEQKKTTTISKKPEQLMGSVDPVPFSTSRVSRSEFSYSFPITPGTKFIRLHFYPSSYPGGFERTKSFFSVKAGPFVLLSNFSSSLAADAESTPTVSKEFCMNVGEDTRLNLTFTPSDSSSESFAFINGIEVVSVPENLYYAAKDDLGFEFIGQQNTFRVERNIALETIARLNVGGREIPPENDTGMFRRWTTDEDYFDMPKVITLPFNMTIHLRFSMIPNYSAPEKVYKTARTMGRFKEINKRQNLTWEIPVDSGFMYFLRLHFCEFQSQISETYDRLFYIYVADQVADLHADVIQWSGGKGVPVYRDYAVLMGREEGSSNSQKRNLSVALHTAKDWQTRYSDVILNGIELFKLSNIGNLAGPNPDPLPVPVTSSPTQLPMKTKRCSVPVAVAAGIVAAAVVALFFLIRRRRGVVGTQKACCVTHGTELEGFMHRLQRLKSNNNSNMKKKTSNLQEL